VFTDRASGARADRPQLTAVLDQLRPGDTLVVWKLDRLGRSLRHLVDTVTGLAARGVGFRSLQEQADTTTRGGKLVFHIFAALAEFERDLVRERTTAGLVAAGARGRTGGRPTVMTPATLQVARQQYASGEQTVAAIAATLGSAAPPSTAISGPPARRTVRMARAAKTRDLCRVNESPHAYGPPGTYRRAAKPQASVVVLLLARGAAQAL